MYQFRYHTDPISGRSLNATTWNVQAFTAADITADWLMFITTGVLPGTFMIPGCTFHCPDTHSSTGTQMPGYPWTGLLRSILGTQKCTNAKNASLSHFSDSGFSENVDISVTKLGFW